MRVLEGVARRAVLPVLAMLIDTAAATRSDPEVGNSQLGSDGDAVTLACGCVAGEGRAAAPAFRPGEAEVEFAVGGDVVCNVTRDT